MKLARLNPMTLVACALAAICPAVVYGDEKEGVQARAAALETAGAFSNDGFKIRDGHWITTISPDQPKLIQVNLFAGNHYWFIAAASEGAKQIHVSLFDELGKPIATEPYQNESRSAAGYAPKASGPYYVRVEETEGTPATFCLLYSYK